MGWELGWNSRLPALLDQRPINVPDVLQAWARPRYGRVRLTYEDGIRHVRAVRMDAGVRGWATFPIGPIRFYVTQTEVLRLGPMPAYQATIRKSKQSRAN